MMSNRLVFAGLLIGALWGTPASLTARDWLYAVEISGTQVGYARLSLPGGAQVLQGASQPIGGLIHFKTDHWLAGTGEALVGFWLDGQNHETLVQEIEIRGDKPYKYRYDYQPGSGAVKLQSEGFGHIQYQAPHQYTPAALLVHLWSLTYSGAADQAVTVAVHQPKFSGIVTCIPQITDTEAVWRTEPALLELRLEKKESEWNLASIRMVGGSWQVPFLQKDVTIRLLTSP